MNPIILNFLKTNFPKEYGSKKYNYIVDPSDLTVIAKFINNILFNNKLNFDLINIFTVTKIKNNTAGNFYIGKENYIKANINIKINKNGDNFGFIVSVLCHELIHVYDYFCGELKNHINSDGTLEIKNINNYQYVGTKNYDAHGRYFNFWIKKFNNFGIIVKKSYIPNERIIMKNINEDEVSCSFFDDPEIELTESENVDNPEYKKQLEKAFNSIINTNKEFKYIDEDHWYFCMD